MNKLKQYLIPAVIVAIVAVGMLYLLTSRDSQNNNTDSDREISNYQECIDAGYPSLESYPAQCKTDDGKSFTEDIGNELENTDKIRSTSPRPNQEISSPLVITGEAVGNWFFEASFPAELVDANGKKLAEAPITAQGEWMTTNFVPYKGTITFATPETPTGTLILKRDNPSGLAENDGQLRIPVKFSEYSGNSVDKTTIKVFFNNSSLGAECEETLAVSREVISTPAIARAALVELLKGLTQEETSKGYTTLISPGVKINSLSIENGIATVDFSSELENNSGGSCRALGIRSQISETLKQFPTVNNVVISVDGNVDALQP